MGDLALRGAAAFDADFAGVDIIVHRGAHYILEVNFFPGFAGFEGVQRNKDFDSKRFLKSSKKGIKRRFQYYALNNFISSPGKIIPVPLISSIDA